MQVHQIRAQHQGKLYPIRRYIAYTHREAVAKYRAEFGLKGKHNVKLTIC